jgi:hypothetical protein
MAKIAGRSNAQIAKDHGLDESTVRRQCRRERAVHGPDWPLSCPATRAAPAPAPRPITRRLGPDSTADEIEARALEVLEDECQAEDASTARIAAARALVELADKRRGRRPAGDAVPVDPAEAAAAIMREIERATSNVEPDKKSTDAASIVVADVPGV